MLNLTKEDISPEAVEIDRSMWKIISLAVVGTIALGFFGYFLKLFVTGNNFNNLIFAVIGGGVFLIVFLLKPFFIKSGWRATLFLLIECLVLLSFFYDKIGFNLILIAIGLAFLMLIWGNRSGSRELGNTMKVNFWRVSKAALPKAFAALALFTSVVLIGLPNTEFFISRENFKGIFIPSATLAKKFFPDFNPNFSVDEIVRNMVLRQLEQSSESQYLPKSVKEQLVNKSIQDFELKVISWAGTSFNTKIALTEALYDLMKSEYDSLAEKDRQLVLIGTMVFVFLLIEGFVFPVRVAITFLAYLVYEILLALGFATIILEGRSREVVVLK